MERQTIDQLTKGAVEALGRLGYARVSITHYRQAFSRVARFAAKNGTKFLSEDLTKGYLFDTYGWDMHDSIAPSAHIQSQLRAIRVLECYEQSGSIPGRYSQPKEAPDCFKNQYELYMSECANRGLSDATMARRSSDVGNLLVYAKMDILLALLK